MAKNANIIWGVGNVNTSTLKEPTHRVISIYVNAQESTVSIIIEKGTEVDTVKMSMDKAQQIGFINVEALSPFL